MKKILALVAIAFCSTGAIVRARAQSKQSTAIAVVIEVTKQVGNNAYLEAKQKPGTIMEVREGIVSHLSEKGFAVDTVEMCSPYVSCVIPSDKSQIVFDIVIDRPWNRWMKLTIRATYKGKTLLAGTVKSSAWTLTPQTGETLAKAYALLDRMKPLKP